MGILELRYSRLDPRNLYRQKAHYDKEIHAVNQLDSVLNRSVGVFLSSLGVIGAITFFFVPPVGLGILGACAVLGGGYALARGFIALKKWYDKWRKPAKDEQNANELRGEDDAVKSKLQSKPEMTLDIEHSPEKMLDAVSHPSSPTQSVVSKILADVKGLLGLTKAANIASPIIDNNVVKEAHKVIDKLKVKPKVSHEIIRGENKGEDDSEGEGQGGPHPHQ